LTLQDNIQRAVTKENPFVDINTDLSIVQKFHERYSNVLAYEKDGDKISKIYSIKGRDLLKFYK